MRPGRIALTAACLIITPLAPADSASGEVSARVAALHQLAVVNAADDLSARRRGRRGREESEPPPETVRLCIEDTLGVPDETAARIGAAIGPTAEQRTLLEALKAATQGAVESLRASCAVALPVNPVARFEAWERQAEAMLQAFAAVRPALEALDRSLSDEQRTRFGIMTAQASRDEHRPSLCNISSMARWPLDRISHELRPDVTQRNALIDLWAASAKAMNTLEAECPRETPITPLARLQSLEKRFGATHRAVRTVRLALAEFYRGLNDDQKARFDQMNLRGGRDEPERPRMRGRY
jgi:LTXXQ motif family protein